MHSAQGGHLAIVRALLAAGAPWNALDRQGRCAGEYAMAAAGEGVAEVRACVRVWGLGFWVGV
jgi:type IV protein arginine methyltransferase